MAIDVDISMQQFFFDRQKVIDQVGKANAKRLSKAGAFIRQTARTKILRRRKGVSPPGSPPSVHAKSGDFASLKNILFHMDPNDESVIVGPVKTNMRERTPSGNTTVPQRHEFGGVGVIAEEAWQNSNNWRRRDWRRSSNPLKKYRVRRARYAKRPFMGPALQTEINKGTIIGLFASIQ